VLIALGHKRYFNTSSCGQAIKRERSKGHGSKESSKEGTGEESRETREEGWRREEVREEVTLLHSQANWGNPIHCSEIAIGVSNHPYFIA